MTDDQKAYCTGCDYLGKTGSDRTCDYLIITGCVRGGSVGKGCVHHTKKNPKAAQQNTRKNRPPLDEIRAMELFREGLDDISMAESLGVSLWRVENWRKQMHLKRPRGGARPRKPKETKEKTGMAKYKERTVEDAVIEAEQAAEAATEARGKERELQESAVDSPVPVKPRPAGIIRMESHESPPEAMPPSGWSLNDFSMAHRCIGVIEGVAEGITLNPNAKDRLLQAARTLCELMEKARTSNNNVRKGE